MADRVALAGLEDLDLSGLVAFGPTSPDFLAPVIQRAQSRALRGQPLSPRERFAAFAHFGFTPHGLYVPQDRDLQRLLYARLWQDLGALPDEDHRIAAYLALQQETAGWEAAGLPGAWNGQQAVARCTAQFRVTGWGRRTGKTEYAAHEAAAYLWLRPGCTVWLCARTMQQVGRCWDVVEAIIRRMGWKIVRHRDSRDERLLELESGCRLEGVSLNTAGERDSAPGASVALTVVDEGAQVSQDAWIRAVYPPLTDNNGQALVLSSFNGEGNWFYEQIEKVKANPHNTAWKVFLLESYHNFYVHPRGRQSPALVQAQIDADDPMEYLEQYCAIPRRGRNLVFPQYRDSVHAAEGPLVAFDPHRPVYVTGDPSGGANPYAVLAIQQYPERGWQEHVVIDSYYKAGALAEDMTADCQQRPWFPNVTEMIIDGAYPAEVERLTRLGWPVFGIEDKPKVETRLPVYRRLLRDPLRFYPIRQERLGEILDDQGLTWEEYQDLEPRDQQPYLIRLEERLSDERLTEQDILQLTTCSHIVFARLLCWDVIREHKAYQYEQVRRMGQTRDERARKWNDHAMDALGYYAWHYTRSDYFDQQEHPEVVTAPYLTQIGAGQQFGVGTGPGPAAPPDLGPRREERQRLFLRHLRDQHRPPNQWRGRSMMRTI